MEGELSKLCRDGRSVKPRHFTLSATHLAWFRQTGVASQAATMSRAASPRPQRGHHRRTRSDPSDWLRVVRAAPSRAAPSSEMLVSRKQISLIGASVLGDACERNDSQAPLGAARANWLATK